MLPVIIDRDKCNADGICVAVCPRKLIKFNDEESKPRPIPEAAELCFNSGHCLTVCPSGAITLNGIKPEDCAGTKKDGGRAMMRWIYYFDRGVQYLYIKQALDIPYDHKVYGAMIAGYPKYAYKKIPHRNQPNVAWW